MPLRAIKQEDEGRFSLPSTAYNLCIKQFLSFFKKKILLSHRLTVPAEKWEVKNK